KPSWEKDPSMMKPLAYDNADDTPTNRTIVTNEWEYLSRKPAQPNKETSI
ncbi:6128_t:CDS:1, partial [Acaulospora morrowiae]